MADTQQPKTTEVQIQPNKISVEIEIQNSYLQASATNQKPKLNPRASKPAGLYNRKGRSFARDKKGLFQKMVIQS